MLKSSHKFEMKVISRRISLFMTAFFVTSSNLLAQSAPPLRLDLPPKAPRDYRFFGPNANPNSTLSDPNGTRVRVKGEMLTIDTQNPEACRQMQSELIHEVGVQSSEVSAADFCDSRDGRYVNVIRFGDDEDDDSDVRSTIFSETNKLSDKVKDFAVLGIGAMAIIAALPASVSRWEDGTFDNPLKKWKKNVTSAPVIDKDDWTINYIGHPVSGGIYYVVARNLGHSPLESFAFSALMSTFYWEYGFEALAERPSIQDLLITPIIGSLFGEGMYRMSRAIEANNGKIAGSRLLGSIGLVLADPAGALMHGVNRLTRNRLVYSSKLEVGAIPRWRSPLLDPYAKRESQFGFRILMKLNVL